jgi:hypothetical protein
MKLQPLKYINDKEWDDAIERFEMKSLYHQSAWLEFIEKSQKTQRTLLEIENNGKTIGYFACFIVRKGPFKILGSPLIGWNTGYLGPISNYDFDQTAFFNVFEQYCRDNKIDQVELSNPILNSAVMKNNNFSFRSGITYLVRLFCDEKKMWFNLDKKSCRYAIHKAEKSNLTVEDTDNPKIIDEYFNQLQEVFGKQKLVPTYGRERVSCLFNCLKSRGLLYSLWVKHGNEIIATGLFPHDNRTVYFFGGSSWLKYHHLCPNDILQWTLMKKAAKDGISCYNMGGAGSFKPKFGGEATTILHWYKSYNFLAKISRYAYSQKFLTAQRIKGAFK